MMNKRLKKHTRLQLLALLITLVGILLDQVTKLLVSANMSLYQSIPLIKGVIHITYVQNRGAAFGMLDDKRWIFLVSSSITILVVAAYLALAKNENTLQVISLALILSGGIGNMIDRLSLGYVVDFIDFTLIDFAVFNGADSFVCVGAALLILTLLLEMKEDAELQKRRNEFLSAGEEGAADASAEPPRPDRTSSDEWDDAPSPAPRDESADE